MGLEYAGRTRTRASYSDYLSARSEKMFAWGFVAGSTELDVTGVTLKDLSNMGSPHFRCPLPMDRDGHSLGWLEAWDE